MTLAITIILGIIAAAEVFCAIVNQWVLSRANAHLNDRMVKIINREEQLQDRYNQLLEYNIDIVHENSQLKATLELRDKKEE